MSLPHQRLDDRARLGSIIQSAKRAWRGAAEGWWVGSAPPTESFRRRPESIPDVLTSLGGCGWLHGWTPASAGVTPADEGRIRAKITESQFPNLASTPSGIPQPHQSLATNPALCIPRGFRPPVYSPSADRRTEVATNDGGQPGRAGGSSSRQVRVFAAAGYPEAFGHCSANPVVPEAPASLI